MNKISVLFTLILLISACKNNENTNKTQKEQENKQETISREADHSKTKFVLFQSDYEPKITYQKIKNYLEEKGMYYPRIVDHETAAKNAQIELNTIYLVIFGNPKDLALLMQENPEVGIELPLKLLIYKDDENRTWVMYKNINYLKDLYFIKDPNAVIEAMNQLQEGFKKAVTNPIETTQINETELQ